MRPFKDDLTREVPITWAFTKPDAKWCGFPNVFNSRNWYLGVDEPWPVLGEVQGASRPWANGVGLCAGLPGPFGTADQWEQGALASDATGFSPCRTGEGSTWSPVGCSFFNVVLSEEVVGMQFGPDRFAGQSIALPGFWYTYDRRAGQGACCYPDGGAFRITGGPPGFVDSGMLFEFGGNDFTCETNFWFGLSIGPFDQVQVNVQPI